MPPEAEAGAMWPRVKRWQQPPEAGGGTGGILARSLQGEHGSANTRCQLSGSGFRLLAPELCVNKFLLS